MTGGCLAVIEFFLAVNAPGWEKRKNSKLNFLDKDVKYRMTLITDGKHDKELSTAYSVVGHSSSVNVKLLRRGGFVAAITPI